MKLRCQSNETLVIPTRGDHYRQMDIAAGRELHVDWSGLEVLEPDQCFELLRHTAVGRVGFIDQGGPVILPVNFAMDGHSPVFKTAHGSKLSAAMVQKPICLEIDSWDLMGHIGWSVLAKGVADLIMDDDEIERLEQLPVQPWTRPDLRHHWIKILVEETTGRRIVEH